MLNIGETQVEAPPNGIVKLKSLRYLIQSMAQLVRLEISNIKGSDEEDLCFAIQNMPLLRRLLVKAAKEDQILRLDALKSPPPFLEQLVLIGKLENIPQWFQALQNLRRLSLVGSRLMYDPLSHLETLPSLRHLHLLKFCEELHLEFKNGFHNLQSLHGGLRETFPHLDGNTTAKGFEFDTTDISEEANSQEEEEEDSSGVDSKNEIS
ncbi:hypothetical protein Tsubulata_030664 [Turnera subulata]|uniref:NB-ARC domain-containing protein n=1 Tax=Turnera subulata TaxID=218843 RepID=A0A9Q0J2F9_9ROSI|nr:hypothetical protein Tsubulata_030664 [Turnera subulata]